MVPNTKMWEHPNQWNNFTRKSPWFCKAVKYRKIPGIRRLVTCLENWNLDTIFRSRKYQGSQDQSLMKFEIHGIKHLYLQFYQDANWRTYTTLMISAFSIKDFPSKPCTWKARNVVAVSTEKFGWLEWQLKVLLERSYQYF